MLAGNLVGGSSAVNAMMTIRGTKEDYDRWGQFFSNSSEWSWSGLLPYFKKALNFLPPNEDVVKSVNLTYDASYWGNTSGVYAGWPSFQYPGTAAQVNAFREIPGVEFPEDSGAGKPGVYWYPTFMGPNVQRSYARTGHYLNVRRANYHLITDSKVMKIVLDGTTATGVSFVPVGAAPQANCTAGSDESKSPACTSNGPTVVQAKREIILSAGAIHSPQVMQLSGLGPKKLLASVNITSVVDLPGVGQNFQDHPMLTAAFQCKLFAKDL